MLLLQLDDRAVLQKLRILYQQLHQQHDDVNEEDILLEVNNVLESPKFTTSTKKVAYQIKNLLSPTQPGNWIGLAAFIGSCTAENLIVFLNHWVKVYPKHNLGPTDSEFLFVSELIQRVAKSRKQIVDKLNDEIFKSLKRNLLISAFILYECRSEDTTHLIKSVLKLFDTFEERQELRWYILDEFPKDSPSALFALGLLCSAETLEQHEITKIFEIIPHLACSQDLATLSSGIVTHLFSDERTSQEMIKLAVSLLLSSKNIVRHNLTRVWLSRLSPNKKILANLVLLTNIIRVEWNRSEKKEFDPFWPLHVWEFEDISCINAEWTWEESDDVLEYRDRVLSAFIALANILLRRFKNVPITLSDPLIESALKWPNVEIRLGALQIIRLLNAPADQYEVFIMANFDSTSDDLLNEIRDIVKTTELSVSCLEIWNQQEKERKHIETERDEGGNCFMSEDMTIPELPEVTHIPERVSFLLQVSGSRDSDECPTFPVLYEHLQKAHINHRVFTKELTSLMNKLVSSESVPFDTVVSTIWTIITRCRMKAVVDQGCTLLEKVLPKNLAVVDECFEKASQALLSPSSSVRTLCVSRILWTTCASNSTNFCLFWAKVSNFIENPGTTTPSVLSRVLKTLKLFFSKADCDLPLEAYSTLFRFCIKIQTHEDFLVRSSATILFGFTVRAITKSRQQPLFYLVYKWNSIWQHVKELVRSSTEQWTSPQRILLLTFFSQFYLGHQDFYILEDSKVIETIKDVVSNWIQTSPCIRERRFCTDVIISLVPVTKHLKISNLIRSRVNSHGINSFYDGQYLMSLLREDRSIQFGENERKVPLDLTKSIFIQKICKVAKLAAEVKESSLREDLEEMFSIFNELSLNDETSTRCAAYIICLIAQAASNYKIPLDIKQNIVTKCSILISSEFNRVNRLTSRVAVELGLTSDLLQDKHFLEVMYKWAMHE
ncbi:unnamed protein product [Auanema sp. JU1783]|nr:unnamed protein product [Auanema sp. JU1783]